MRNIKRRKMNPPWLQILILAMLLLVRVSYGQDISVDIHNIRLISDSQPEGTSGDATYVEIKNNGNVKSTLLCDAGREGSAAYIKQYLTNVRNRAGGRRAFDIVVATHPDVDHIGGFVGTGQPNPNTTNVNCNNSYEVSNGVLKFIVDANTQANTQGHLYYYGAVNADLIGSLKKTSDLFNIMVENDCFSSSRLLPIIAIPGMRERMTKIDLPDGIHYIDFTYEVLAANAVTLDDNNLNVSLFEDSNSGTNPTANQISIVSAIKGECKRRDNNTVVRTVFYAVLPGDLEGTTGPKQGLTGDPHLLKFPEKNFFDALHDKMAGDSGNRIDYGLTPHHYSMGGYEFPGNCALGVLVGSCPQNDRHHPTMKRVVHDMARSNPPDKIIITAEDCTDSEGTKKQKAVECTGNQGELSERIGLDLIFNTRSGNGAVVTRFKEINCDGYKVETKSVNATQNFGQGTTLYSETTIQRNN